MSARLQANAITVVRGARRLVDGADVVLKAGELTILVGPNGAGKTTFVRALAGLIGHDGDVHIDGKPFAVLSLRQRARAIAYLPQGHEFHWPMRGRGHRRFGP